MSKNCNTFLEAHSIVNENVRNALFHSLSSETNTSALTALLLLLDDVFRALRTYFGKLLLSIKHHSPYLSLCQSLFKMTKPIQETFICRQSTQGGKLKTNFGFREIWSKNIWQKDTSLTDIWSIDTSLTDMWPTIILQKGSRVTGIWPKDCRPTDIWPKRQLGDRYLPKKQLAVRYLAKRQLGYRYLAKR